MTLPTFGLKEENVEYVTRYGVYAVIPDENKEKIILVQASVAQGGFPVQAGEAQVGGDPHAV